MGLLTVISGCGESEPQFVGTAHVLRVLDRIEAQQTDAAARLTAIEATVGDKPVDVLKVVVVPRINHHLPGGRQCHRRRLT